MLWILPGVLDIERLKVSVAHTISLYPHTAGRLSWNEIDKLWQIKLTNEGVPITAGTTDLAFDDEFLKSDSRHPDIIDSLSTKQFRPDLLKLKPLVKFKVTSNQLGETAFHMAFSHLLGE